MHPLTLPDGRGRALPTRWGQVTLGQSARLAELPEGADTYSLLSVLLDLSPVEVMNLPADFVTEHVLPALDFAFAGEVPPLERDAKHTSLLLPIPDGHVCLPVNRDLSAITFGQATDLGAVLQDATMSVHEKRQRLLAILLYPAYHGTDYDSDGIDDFARDICSQAMLEEALPLTDFFLLSSTAFGGATWPSSNASPSPLTSGRPDSKPWWRNGMRWLSSTHWPLATKRSGPTSGASSGARSTP